jgi:excisionase family DNA binding protein
MGTNKINQSADGRLLDADGAAAYLGTTTRHVRRLTQERKLAFFRVGRFVRFARADLDAFLRSSRVETR